MYGFTLSVQFYSLFMFLGLGFLLGIVYDAARMIRLSISKGKTALYICDVLFAVFASGVTFCFCLAVNYGELHLYMLLGEIVGFFIYYITFDAFIRKVTGQCVTVLKRIWALFFKIFSLPIRVVVVLALKIRKPAQFLSEKNKKFFNFLLQKNKPLLYNIFGILKRKRATSDEEK